MVFVLALVIDMGVSKTATGFLALKTSGSYLNNSFFIAVLASDLILV